jgi:transposase
METREQRGIIIAATIRLAEAHGVWVVPSQTGGDKRYMVDPKKGTCSCPDHQETGFKCKHQWAVEFTVRRLTTPDGVTVEQQTFKWTEEKTYSQDWPNYNRAQMEEKDRLQELLADICRTLPEPERTGRKGGNVPHKISDRVFACCFKVYCGISGRRTTCDMNAAHEAGYLSRAIHPSKVSAFFCDADLTSVLQELVSRTALPLAAVESDFATDSSGFSVCKFVRWHDEKYGEEKSGRDWVKVHICTGVKTNCITAAAVYDRHANDAPILPELVDKTAAGFRMREVSADKGYLTGTNVDAIHNVGATPFIAPKSNSTGGIGGLFEKMIHFYRFNQAEYMDHYHKRSNVESTFSAVKRLFGDSVRGRNPAAMVNEVYAKFICYNLTCVIHSQLELGIEANFSSVRPSHDEPEPAILKFVRPAR